MCPGWLATPLCAVGRVLLGRENLRRVVKHKNPDGSPLVHLSLGTVGSPQEGSRASPAKSEHSFPGTPVPGEAPQRGLSAGVTLQKCHLHASCWHEGVLKPLQSLAWLAAGSGVRLNRCCPGTALGRGPGLPFIAQPRAGEAPSRRFGGERPATALSILLLCGLMDGSLSPSEAPRTNDVPGAALGLPQPRV